MRRSIEKEVHNGKKLKRHERVVKIRRDFAPEEIVFKNKKKYKRKKKYKPNYSLEEI